MRRIIAITGTIVFLDAMLFGAIIPLLPHFADQYDLSKLEAGLLLGAYGGRRARGGEPRARAGGGLLRGACGRGALVGGIPGGLLVSRVGPRAGSLARAEPGRGDL